jgi:hypothetical protein
MEDIKNLKRTTFSPDKTKKLSIMVMNERFASWLSFIVNTNILGGCIMGRIFSHTISVVFLNKVFKTCIFSGHHHDAASRDLSNGTKENHGWLIH